MISGVEQIFSDPTLSSLKLTLQAASVRHEAIASNIANVNTPGYKRVDVSDTFKASLDTALHQLNEGQQLGEAPQASIVTSEVQNPARFDGNTVSLDQEMTELMKNQADFDFSARILSLKYGTLKEAISGTVSNS